jgi:hypothetical protein
VEDMRSAYKVLFGIAEERRSLGELGLMKVNCIKCDVT